jgi:hypothetical protein
MQQMTSGRIQIGTSHARSFRRKRESSPTHTLCLTGSKPESLQAAYFTMIVMSVCIWPLVTRPKTITLSVPLNPGFEV